MFDPHHIGPRRSSSYSRNKGRVIQRRAVNTPSPGYTRSELEQLVPLMKVNGFIPPPPSPYLGKVVNYRVLVDGVDRTNDYTAIDAAHPGNTAFLNEGVYFYIVVNYTTPEIAGNFMAIKVFRIPEYALYRLSTPTVGSRFYSIGTGTPDVVLEVTGENGTVVNMVFIPTTDIEPDNEITFANGVTLLPM